MQVDDEKCNRASDIVVAKSKRERRGGSGMGVRERQNSQSDDPK